MNFEDFQYSFITGARDLYDYVSKKRENNEKSFRATWDVYQVTYYLYDQKVIDREFGVYTGIADNYPKYVISMDKPDFSREGIIHLNALEFLKDELH